MSSKTKNTRKKKRENRFTTPKMTVTIQYDEYSKNWQEPAYCTIRMIDIQFVEAVVLPPNSITRVFFDFHVFSLDIAANHMAVFNDGYKNNAS